ncbi:unnamed protein product [Phytomonas sp. Hart1]|nr:unnamed protein product [Phytomonas sp. Hart1]|eukprot:CCW67462.1 unnamed protein product [Phytomonas sp. isolate Hart1]
MPYWKNYLCSKPEVDDDDLPLPEHRIFDDYGNIKAQVARQVRSLFGRKEHTTAAAKRDTYILPRLLRVIFAKKKL